MKNWIVPLSGTYRGTDICISNNNATHILRVCLPKNGDREPSDRELENLGISRDEWDNGNDGIWDCIDGTHYEPQGVYIEALELMDKLNKI